MKAHVTVHRCSLRASADAVHGVVDAASFEERKEASIRLLTSAIKEPPASRLVLFVSGAACVAESRRFILLVLEAVALRLPLMGYSHFHADGQLALSKRIRHPMRGPHA